MSDIDFLLERLAEQPSNPALLWRSQSYDGHWLLNHVRADSELLDGEGVAPGSVVVLHADYSPRAVSVLLAAVARRSVLAPLLPSTLSKGAGLLEVIDPAFQIDVTPDGDLAVKRFTPGTPHPLIASLQKAERPGLILFTSGSTGAPKGVLHDFGRLLVKFHKRRPVLRTLNFLLFDHWGGLNTLFHCLANNSPVVLPESRTADAICQLMEHHRVELLPASPTFLNLLLLSKAYEGRDLSHLRLITYGSEPMPAATLTRLREVFPGVELRQTYGLIELGVLRAKSLSSDSLWVKVGGEGYDLRVVDGILQIKADSAMLGYLNAPSPFTEDGYFITGDRVELNGEYMRFLGRDSELINVGGQKVFPAEVETVLLECPLVQDAVVYGEKHPITGKIVCADVSLSEGADEAEAKRAIKRFCSGHLDPYKIPVKIRFVTAGLHSDRLKRVRIGRA
ncbi:MAG TPA: AMP-binding protein [Bryobacteraceae bacterium]|nr:AMP-binding protein [Bryobacteraceae bacterium]